MMTFCSAVVRGSRLKLWKTKPSLAVRTSARWLGVNWLISWPSSQIFARTGPVEAAQDVHQRGLAGAGGAHQRHHLAAIDRERDALEHRDVDLAQVIGLGDVFQPDEFHGYFFRRP